MTVRRYRIEQASLMRKVSRMATSYFSIPKMFPELHTNQVHDSSFQSIFLARNMYILPPVLLLPQQRGPRHRYKYYFVPIVAETLGGLSEVAIDTIKSIGRLQGQRLGIPPPDSTRHLFQRLAISLWKGNATLWIRRQPTRPAAVDGIV